MTMSDRRGFNLIEIMCVCAIVTILCGGILVRYDRFRRRSAEVLREEERLLTRGAIDLFHRRLGRYPASLEELRERGFLDHGTRAGARAWATGWEAVRGHGPRGGVTDVRPVVTREEE
jgi:prepilin-type N-terminal cleavage/methylation domain-containing protein